MNDGSVPVRLKHRSSDYEPSAVRLGALEMVGMPTVEIETLISKYDE